MAINPWGATPLAGESAQLPVDRFTNRPVCALRTIALRCVLVTRNAEPPRRASAFDAACPAALFVTRFANPVSPSRGRLLVSFPPEHVYQYSGHSRCQSEVLLKARGCRDLGARTR